MTAKRKQVFLSTLAETGSTVVAAETATPWGTGTRGGVQSFYDERVRDPHFAADWERAADAALAMVESEIMRRAMTPVKRPIFNKGEYVTDVEQWDNRLLLRVASKLSPAWHEKRKNEISGVVAHTHQHQHGVVVATLDARDVLLLSDSKRQTLMQLVGEIADAKGESTDVETTRLYYRGE